MEEEAGATGGPGDGEVEEGPAPGVRVERVHFLLWEGTVLPNVEEEDVDIPPATAGPGRPVAGSAAEGSVPNPPESPETPRPCGTPSIHWEPVLGAALSSFFFCWRVALGLCYFWLPGAGVAVGETSHCSSS